ncbi:GerAB/ArcD/ProY family transporter [Cytobacillus sp. IB215665]|uniref:GerAB/ArcD/ProY family transporter n=1 Tax=Cytobacillus sp. IB215665 TaxID=3097357 RepID=UPI002A15A9F9|nr:GerAB/ArcD/ProY family transporter [Cytobacillus sp. IB215665]MDX8366667.1 GerAB/ArcD/ProY family transporter [Cytobacillus sp. IB215665]
MQEKLQPHQIFALIYMCQISVGIFSLPRITAEAFGTNGWLGIGIVSVFFVVNIILIGLVFSFGKGRTIFNIMDILPKFLLCPFYICVALLYGALGILIAKNFQLILSMLYYPNMSILFVVLMAILTYWLVRRGIYHIAKATVVFFSTILIALLLGFHIPEFSFTRLTPFIFEGEKELLMKGNQVGLHFLGVEIALLFIPYISKLSTAMRPILFAHLLLTFIYLATCFISFGFFSFEQLINDVYPVITLLEYVEFPIVERVEGFVVNLFMFEVLVTIVLFFWGADQFLQQALPKIPPRLSILCLLLVSSLITAFINTRSELELWIYWLRSGELLIAMLLPIILLILIGVHHLYRKK